MKTGRPLFLISAVLALGCGAGSDDPRQIAEAFWKAGQAGDIELAKTYVSESSTASLKEPDDSADSAIRDLGFGETQVDGDTATVETEMTAAGGEGSIRIAFHTYLVREDRDWKVDLDKTSDDMMRSMLGVSVSEMAEQMGRAMGEAMGGAMEGMAEAMGEGMQALGDSLAARSEGAKEGRR